MTVNLGTAYISIEPDLDTFNTKVAAAMPGVQRRLSGLTTDTDRAHRTTSGFSTATSGLARGLTAAAGAAAAAAAAYIGISQAKSAISATTDLAKVTAGLTRNLGLSTEAASRWGTVAYARDIDTKSLTMSFTTLSRQITEAAKGSETARGAFADIGVTQRDLARTGGDFQKQLMLVAGAFGDAEGGALRQQAAQKLLGRGYQTLLPLFAEGTKSLREQLGWADKYGTTLDKHTTKKLMEFVSAQRESKVAWLGLQKSFSVAVLPLLTEVQDQFQHLAHIVNNPKLSPEEKWQKATQAIWHLVKKWGGKALDAIAEVGRDLGGSLFLAFKVDMEANADRYAAIVANSLIDVWNSAVNSAVDKLKDNPAFKLLLGPFTNLDIATNIAANIGTPHITVPEAVDTSGGGAVKAAKGYRDLAESLAEMFRAARRARGELGKTGEDAEGAGKRADKGAAHLESYGKAAQGNAELASRSLGRHALDADKYMDYVGRDLKRGEDRTDDYARGADKSYDHASDSARTMSRKVGGSVGSAAKAVQGAMTNIAKNTNEALKGFGVKKLSFAFDTVGNAVGDVLHAQRGRGFDVPGMGYGDTEAMHIGGRLAAMVEPGERIFVLNRNASAAMRALEQANQRVPRFAAGGGMIVGIPGFPGESIDRRILPDVERLVNAYRLAIYDGYAPTGHAANGEHPLGLAIDAGPGAGGSWGLVDKLAHWAEPTQNAPIDPFRWVGYDGDAGHGRGNHIHLSWQHGPGFPAEWVKTLSGKSVGGGAASIPKIKIKGPAGPYRDAAQAAVDAAHRAATKYVNSKAMVPVREVGGVSGGVLSMAELTRLAKSVGGPPIQPWVAYAESGGDPHNGNGTYEGLYAMGAPYWAAYAKGLGPWQPNVYDPVKASRAFVSGYNAVGLGPWADSQWKGGGGGWGQHAGEGWPRQRGGYVARKLGGWVPHLAGGGKPKRKKPLGAEISGGHIDPQFKAGMMAVRAAQRLSDRLQPMLTERGPIARIDERIGLAETAAGQDSSPGGSELTTAEINRQIVLNRSLLRRLRAANRIAVAGGKVTHIAPALARALGKMPGGKGITGKLRTLAQSFDDVRLEMAGATGKGGRIADAQFNLDTLRHTAGAGTAAMDISGLRSVIEAARYGVFDGLVGPPVMHAGGVFKAPRGRLEGPAILANNERVLPAPSHPADPVFVGTAIIELGDGVREVVDLEFKRRDAQQHLTGRRYRPR